MVRTNPRCLLVAVAFALAAPLGAQDIQRSAQHDFRLVPVVEGLEIPWSMAFLPGGEAWMLGLSAVAGMYLFMIFGMTAGMWLGWRTAEWSLRR